MTPTKSSPGLEGSAPVRRRTVIASLAAAGTALSGGCLRRLRTLTGWESPDRLSLRIKTLPSDVDPYAQAIARRLADWYRTVGIDARVVPMAAEALLRGVLVDHEFDVFVARVPREFRTPDALYSLLHSKQTAASGWQNPFGFANLEVDERLETQRHAAGRRRREAIEELQRLIARTQPFTVIAFPDEIRAGRQDRFSNSKAVDLGRPLGYLALRSGIDGSPPGDRSGEPDRQPGRLRVVTTDGRVTETLNPLAVQFRRDGVLTDLLYDSLGYATEDGRVHPWLAASWTFDADGDRPIARIRLRDDLTWHDGEPMTAGDVAFTYAFLADTSDEETGDGPVPVPRYRGRTDLVTGAHVLDRRTLDLEFVECDRTVAARAFTVPTLPKHVWARRTDPVSAGGLGPVTEALVTDNVPPVGSGPLAFVRNTPRESVTFERFDEHFLVRGDVPDHLSALAGGPAFDRLTVRVARSDVMAVETVVSDQAELTVTPVRAEAAPRIARSNVLDLLVDRSSRYYFVGYNARRSSLSNPRFRSALAHLVDKSHLVETVFDGYARAATSPFADTDRVPPDLEWAGRDRVTPFLGTDGTLDVGRARDAFRDAGYRFEDGKLLES